MRRLNRGVWSALAVATTAAGASAAPVIDLGTLPTLAPRITPGGMVAGVFEGVSGSGLWRWDAPVSAGEQLQTPDWLRPTRMAMGPDGTLAIAAWDTREAWREAPYLYTDDGLAALDDGGTFPLGVSVPAIGVGGSGQVIGYGRLEDADLPVSFEGEAVVSLPVPLAGARIESGMGLGGGELVLGVSGDGGVLPPRTMAFDGAQWRDLGDPSVSGMEGWMLARACGPDGTLVGGGAASLFAPGEPVLVHPGGPIESLGLMDGWIGAEAEAMNSAGWVVGSATVYDEAIFDVRTQAFAWHDSLGLVELFCEGGWTLLSATGISDDGWVVGIGIFEGVEHAYAMRIPAPATITLLGAAAMSMRRRPRMIRR